MNKPINIKVEEAAIIMQKSALFVREAMKQGYLDIGVVMQMPGSKRHNFRISPPLLAHELGIDVETLFSIVEEMRRGSRESAS